MIEDNRTRRSTGATVSCHNILLNSTRQAPRKSSSSGFTLIEVMIVMAVLAIVAVIAVPSYAQYMTNARRADAISFLSEVAGEQQRYFSQFNEYATDMQELGYPDEQMTSPEGHYQISISNPGSNLRYVLTAAPIADGKQSNDNDCRAFVISNTGARSSTGTKTNCW